MSDQITEIGGNGSIASRLLNNGMNVNALRTNTLLRKDEWIHFDEALIPAVQDRLVGVGDLMSRGLVLRVPNGMGSTVLQWETLSDWQDAEVDMAGITAGSNDAVKYELSSMPLPIVHSGFSITARKLAASRTMGAPLDTTQAQLAGVKVADQLENILFNGSITYGGGTVYGYTNALNRNTGSLTANWDASAATGETILDDVRAMKQAAIDDGHYGPFMLYIPRAYETVLDEDFKSNSDKSVRQRILEVSGINDVKVADKLSANNVVLVQLTSDVVRMVEGLPLTTVEWDTDGGMNMNFKVMTINVPNIRSTQGDKSGVVHYT
jgi:uncharacterized linocin/CFP29 family protein